MMRGRWGGERKGTLGGRLEGGAVRVARVGPGGGDGDAAADDAVGHAAPGLGRDRADLPRRGRLTAAKRRRARAAGRALGAPPAPPRKADEPQESRAGVFSLCSLQPSGWISPTSPRWHGRQAVGRSGPRLERRSGWQRFETRHARQSYLYAVELRIKRKFDTWSPKTQYLEHAKYIIWSTSSAAQRKWLRSKHGIITDDDGEDLFLAESFPDPASTSIGAAPRFPKSPCSALIG